MQNPYLQLLRIYAYGSPNVSYSCLLLVYWQWTLFLFPLLHSLLIYQNGCDAHHCFLSSLLTISPDEQRGWGSLQLLLQQILPLTSFIGHCNPKFRSLPAPIPHGTISPTLPGQDHPFWPFAMPMPPTIFNQRTTLLLGVPLNHGMSFLWTFCPHQGLLLLTSEDNRKTSMARSSKPRKRTQVARPREESLLPDAIDKNISIMLVPHNVRDALLTVILCSWISNSLSDLPAPPLSWTSHGW